MRRHLTLYLTRIEILATLIVLVLAPIFAAAQANDDGRFVRLTANFRGFEGISSEITTNTPPSASPSPGSGGILIYKKSVYVTGGINVLFVTVTATADVHDGAQLLMSCLVDGVACNPGSNPNGAPAGWVILKRYENYNRYFNSPVGGFGGDGGGGAGDLHDNSLHYTWCKKIARKKNKGEDDGQIVTVQIKMAAGDVNGTASPVNLEAVHFFIDGANLRGSNACTLDTTVIH